MCENLEPNADGNQKKNLSDEELRALAEEIVRSCPSLTHLLLALYGRNEELARLN